VTRHPYRALARLAQAHGWTVRPTRGGHLLWTSPAGDRVVSAGTSASWRGLRNHRARLRRAGLDVAGV
jgi:hypothetical protein